MRYDTQHDYDDRQRLDAEEQQRLEADERLDTEAEERLDTEADERLDTEHAAEPEPAVGAAHVPPPAVTATEVDTAALWPEDAVHDLQQRFREVQWHFVDDPRAAADEAHALVTEAVDQFSTTIESRKRELDGWRDTDGGDTEQMRMVVRRYRNLLDRLLGV
jgi:hypothetical protein